MENLYNKLAVEICENASAVIPYPELFGYCQSEKIRALTKKALITGDDSELKREIGNVGGAKGRGVIGVLEAMAKTVKKELSITDEMILEAIREAENIISEKVEQLAVDFRIQTKMVAEIHAAVTEGVGVRDIPDIKANIVKQDTIGEELKTEIERKLDRAKELTDGGDYEEARIVLEDVRKYISELNAETKGKFYNVLCCIFVGLREFGEALAYVDKALGYEPLTKYKLNKAICKIAIEEEKDLEEAKKIIDSVPEDERTNQYHTTLGHYFLEKGEYKNAEAALAKALENEPYSIVVRFNYAGTFLKRLDFARFDREIAWVKNRVDQGTESKLANFHYYYAMAFRFLLEVTQGKPVLLETHRPNVYISGELFELSKIEKELLDKSISYLGIASDFASGLDRVDVALNQSYCLFLAGRHESAKVFLEYIEKKNLPQSRRGIVLSNLGDTYRVLGEFDNAVAIYQKAIDEFGATYDNRLFLAMAHLGLGAPEGPILQRSLTDINKGIEIFEELKEENSDDVLVKNNLGVVYSIIGRHDEAIRLFGEVETVEGKTENVLKNYGTAYFRKGYYRKAFLYYSKLHRKLETEGKYDEELECFMARAVANHVLTPGEEYAAGVGILVTMVYARDARHRQFKCRAFLAVKLLERIDASIENYETKLSGLLILINLYKYEADLETEIEKANAWYDKALGLVERLRGLSDLPRGLKPQLDTATKEFVEKRYGVAGIT